MLITFRQWRRHKLRLGLTISGIVLGVAVFFAVQTANATLVDSLHATIEKLAGKATLQIVGGEAGFSQNILQKVRDTPGVEIAEPVTEAIVSTSLPGGEKLLVLGLDTSSDLTLYDEMFEESGIDVKNPMAFASRADSIAVTRSLASRFGLKENDKITLDTQAGAQTFTIRGFFKTAGAGAVFDGNVAVLDISSAQAAFNRGQNIDRIDIMVAPNETVENARQTLRSELPAGIEVVRPDLRGQSIENAVTSMHLILTMMSFLALSIGVFIIFNSFSVSLNQRWKEIGILRSLGAERGNIQKMFLGEAVLIGLIGSALGVLVGFYLAQIAGKIMGTISVSVYGYAASPQQTEFNFLYAALAFGIGVVASLIAAWLPARAASRLNPVLALSNVENRQREVRTGAARFLMGLTLIIAGLALTRFTTPRVESASQFWYSFLVLSGMVLLLPKFIEWGARILRPLMEFFFGVEGLIAVETMAQSPRRTSATVGALMVGLMLVFSIGALIQSQKAALNRSLDKSFNADLLVTSSEQLHSRTYHFSEATVNQIAALPGVERADEMRTTSVNYGGEEVAVLAHDMDAYFAMSPDLLDEGDAKRARELTSRGEGVLVSNNFALRWNLGLGDTLKLETPNGTLALPVVGLLEYYRSEKGTIFLDRQIYKKYWDDDNVDYILIKLENGVNRAAFKNSIYAALSGEQKAFVYTHEEYKQWVTRLIDQFFTLTYLQMVIAVVVGALGLMNTMIVSVAERKREIGVFRAVGGFRWQVGKMILLEAISISLIGMTTGFLAGMLNAYFMIHTAAKVIAGFNLPFRFPLIMVLIAIPVVIIIALLSAWLPARRAARLPVIDAIGYE
ncbi:MAG: ABC transporter permease [Pyrinomonadaceae bacterium]